VKITVTTIKTGEQMFANLSNSTETEIRSFVSFYNGIKKNGVKKYKVETQKL
jgi:hypothetical protein